MGGVGLWDVGAVRGRGRVGDMWHRAGMRGRGRSGAEAEVECVLGKVCFG